MTEADREADRLPRGNENQSIDHWAQHGVDELTEREAQEQAELGVNESELSAESELSGVRPETS